MAVEEKKRQQRKNDGVETHSIRNNTAYEILTNTVNKCWESENYFNEMEFFVIFSY